MIENTLTCLRCNTVLQAPNVDREIAKCKCPNSAWIQKRPDVNFWAYGAYDPIRINRIKTKDEKDTK